LTAYFELTIKLAENGLNSKVPVFAFDRVISKPVSVGQNGFVGLYARQWRREDASLGGGCTAGCLPQISSTGCLPLSLNPDFFQYCFIHLSTFLLIFLYRQSNEAHESCVLPLGYKNNRENPRKHYFLRQKLVKPAAFKV